MPNAQFDPVLLTGASGFVGNCALRRLLKEGYAVHVLLRDAAKMWRMNGLLDKVTVHRADLLDAAAVQRVVEKVKPKTVLHLAAYGAYESQSDARRIFETNIIGSYNLFEAAVSAKTGLIVNAGSSSEYGYRNDPMKECDRLEPNSIYAVAKAAQTHLCSLVSTKSSGGMATFRLFSVYGPWEEPTRLFPTVIRRARAGLPLEMVSPDTARDFIFVDDVLDAMLNFEKLQKFKGDVFNLGTGIQSTMRDVVAAIQAAAGSKSEVKWGGMKARRWDASRWQADPAKTKEALGWAPKYTLASGAARMAEWMKEVGDDYGR